MSKYIPWAAWVVEVIDVGLAPISQRTTWLAHLGHPYTFVPQPIKGRITPTGMKDAERDPYLPARLVKAAR